MSSITKSLEVFLKKVTTWLINDAWLLH